MRVHCGTQPQDEDEARETLLALEGKTGEPVGQILAGDYGQGRVTEDTRAAWGE